MTSAASSAGSAPRQSRRKSWMIALAASPLPGVRTRPGVYLFAALGDPLRDFFARYKGVAALILTGGGAYLQRITDLAERVFNLPCRLGRPRDVSGLAVATDGPEYAAPIGMLRYAARTSRRPRRTGFRNWLETIFSRP